MRTFATHTMGMLALVAGLAVPAATAAQTPAQPSPLLVDAAWVSQHLKDPSLVIMHVGPKADYDAGHIPGARLIAEDDVAKPHDMARGELMLEFPPLGELRAKVASFGISDSSRIVVYFGKNGILQSSTRIIFTLDYLGLGDRTSLLNGGQAAWTRAGYPLATDVPAAARGTLTARPVKPVVVDAGVVQTIATRANHKLVDARAPVFYSGIEPTMNGARGHIPGAVNIPFTQISDNDRMIDRARLAALFSAAGIKPGDTVVAYCHIGQQGTAVVFGARLLGYPVVLYDGSFQDWAINKRGPVER